MLAKLERRSVSWWLFITVTSVVSASFLTVFSYNVYALCTWIGNGMTCTPGVLCGENPQCLANWTVKAKIEELKYPDSQNQNCPAPHPCLQSTSLKTFHYISATAGGGPCGITWLYGHSVGRQSCGTGNIISWSSNGERALGPGETYENTLVSPTSGPQNVDNNCDYKAKAYTALSSQGTADATDVKDFTAHCP